MRLNPRQQKARLNESGFSYLEPGDVLLSHGETPHYHRRYCVSLLSSAWNQVGPQCYGRQANFKIRKAASLFNRALKVSLQTHSSVWYFY